MVQVMSLLDIACGDALPAETKGGARRLYFVATALLSSLLFAALWGLAVGSQSPHLMMANLYKVPMVILLSSLSAVPAGLLAWKLSGAKCTATDLLLGFASGVFGGTLVMAVLAPLVALYYHSSAWAGPLLGLGTAFLALGTGTIMFVRGVFRRLDAGVSKFPVLFSVMAFVGMQLATLVQLIVLASPILPERTVFSRGVDAVGSVHP